MSLINDMLRDLEARRAEPAGLGRLAGEVRPLPQATRRWRGPLLLVALTLAGGALLLTAGVWLGSRFSPPAPAVRPAAETSPPARLGTQYDLHLDAQLGRQILPLQPPPSPQALLEAQRMPGVPPPALAPATVGAAMPAVNPAPAVSVAPAPLTIVPRVSPAPTAGRGVPATSGSETDAAAKPVKPAAVMPPTTPASAAGQIDRQPVLATPREKAEAAYRSALRELQQGHAETATGLLRQAMKEEATHHPARQLLLRQLLETRQLEEAQAVLTAGLAQDGRQLGWALALARLQVDTGQPEAARQTLARSWPHAQNAPDYAGFYGLLLYRQGLPAEAAAAYRQATRLAPADGRWWYGLGLALQAEGKRDDAREAFRRALACGNLGAELQAQAEQALK